MVNPNIIRADQQSISTIARELEMRNMMYLPKLHDNHFIFYSLETHKYHVLSTKISIENLCSLKDPYEYS